MIPRDVNDMGGGMEYVGHCWNDKAIMIGSAISGTAVMMNIVTSFTT